MGGHQHHTILIEYNMLLNLLHTRFTITIAIIAPLMKTAAKHFNHVNINSTSKIHVGIFHLNSPSKQQHVAVMKS